VPSGVVGGVGGGGGGGNGYTYDVVTGYQKYVHNFAVTACMERLVVKFRHM
jgi:hypothetical protein